MANWVKALPTGVAKTEVISPRLENPMKLEKSVNDEVVKLSVANKVAPLKTSIVTLPGWEVIKSIDATLNPTAVTGLVKSIRIDAANAFEVSPDVGNPRPSH